MTRRLFQQTLAASAFAETPPNIVVILCDDLGYGDVQAFYPEAKMRTPRMDALARDGMRFTDAHSPSSLCTPTRYGLLTGRYCWRTRLKQGVLNGYSPALIEPGRETIASLLKKKGYRTGGFGKWHLGLGTAEKADYSRPLTPSPLDYGFDEYFGIPASLDMPPYVFVEGNQVQEQPTSTIADNGEVKRGPYWRGGPIAPGFRMEDVVPKIASRACQFIDASAKAKRPFFAYVPFTGPHTPWVPSRPYQNKSKAGLYGDFVEEIDASIGKIVDQLQTSGVAANTLVIVTSDNGAPWEKRDAEAAAGHWADGNWRGQKSDIQEGGHRVPFIVRWPAKVKAGQVSSQLLAHVDILATVAELTGIRLGAGMAEDSYSFAPVLLGAAKSRRTMVVHHAGNGMFSIRSGEWKLVLGRGSGGFTAPAKVTPGPGEPAGELYHLKEDPHEDRNLYAQMPDVVKRLTSQLDAWRQTDHSR
ncbi:MAG: sulfatase-like hydrolase/transferase [Bryobacteraceae bacterium]|nr:sulfatase-like hydrolase/transferase [Bryobacteraceae bacterium]